MPRPDPFYTYGEPMKRTTWIIRVERRVEDDAGRLLEPAYCLESECIEPRAADFPRFEVDLRNTVSNLFKKIAREIMK